MTLSLFNPVLFQIRLQPVYLNCSVWSVLTKLYNDCDFSCFLLTESHSSTFYVGVCANALRELLDVENMDIFGRFYIYDNGVDRECYHTETL